MQVVLLCKAAWSQTAINVHIHPRHPIGAINRSALVGGMHLIKTSVDLVLVPVTVTDPGQRLVTGLRRDNFRVFEGKKVQEIRDFSSEDVPVSVGLIVDTSGSMKNKLPRVRDAVDSFCEAANVQDEFFMITFADRPRLATDFTLNATDLENELILTQTGGRTALLDAITLGLARMRSARYAKKALLIISDGGDNHSRYSESAVRAAARESDVLIYSIGIFDHYAPTLEEALGPALLNEIAEPTGGRAFTVDDVGALPAVAHQIGMELRTQYIIGFRPEKAPHDGKWHKLKVKLQRLPNQIGFLRVHAKAGYYAGER